jgi:hypothetical protein
MTTTHVFIVNKQTFEIHLEYLFAGTGAGENTIDFNNSETTQLHHTKENLLIKMMADLERIREGDFVIFYLQQNFSDKIFEGKFYGIFKVKENPFLDNNDENQYLKKELGKSLTFRILLESYKVYSKGITEWEALDEIGTLNSPNQMIWSLIYRKLKGNRGNTMITIYESERMLALLKSKNNNLKLEGNIFKFNVNSQEIEISETEKIYTGRKENMNILERLKKKYAENKVFESHLQTYILQNIGKGTNESLDNIILENYNDIEWIGNEVSCSVGMQKMDICISLKINENERLFIPIELKATEISIKNISQIQKYVNWVKQYYIPNRISEIKPYLVCKKKVDKNTEDFRNIIKKIQAFNTEFNLSLELIEYEIINGNLFFNKYEIS